MDEPLSNLDAALRVQTRAEILKLQQRLGTTTIYVTHDQIEAMTMGDRIAVMSKGVLQQIGAPRNCTRVPRTPSSRLHRFAGDEPAAAAVLGVGRDGQLAGFRPEHVELGNGRPGLAGLDARWRWSSTWATSSSRTSGSATPRSSRSCRSIRGWRQGARRRSPSRCEGVLLFDAESSIVVGRQAERARALTVLEGSTFCVCDEGGDVDGKAAASGFFARTRASSRAGC